MLSLHFPAPKCWLCLIFWLTQGFFALRLRPFDESWSKFLPAFVVTLAISGSIVKFTPSAKDVFAELPFVEVKNTPDWVGKSLKSLLPDVRTAEIVVVAKCSKCNENKVVKQAAADRQAKVRRVYILSEETKDLAKFLSGQDVRTISLGELTKLLGPIENPYRIQITNYTIVEMKPI